MIKAIILAAGLGKRLHPLTKEIPKCLLKIGDTTCLHHQVTLLREAGFRDEHILIITGYKSEIFSKEIKGNFQFINNPAYETGNNILSLFLAKDCVADARGILIINSDTFFCKEILNRILHFQAPNAVVVDNVKKLGEEEMKVRIQHGLVTEFGKSLSPIHAQGEYIGIAKFEGRSIDLLFRILGEFVVNGDTSQWYEAAFDRLAKIVPIHPVYTDGLPWIEIDTLEDFKQAQNLYTEFFRDDFQRFR